MRARLEEVGRFREPLLVTAPPGDRRFFVVEKGGRVIAVEPGGARSTFLDITASVSTGSEQGLLSLAFAPDHATSGLAYVDYTNRQGDTRVVEYRVSSDPNRLDPGSAREILAVDQPFSNHNGGLLVFDASGMMIVGLGDGGAGGDPGNRAQNLSSLLGKLLRIDPRHPAGDRPYSIPAGNPFAGRQDARPEVWAYGLRNPWRFAFDPGNGDLYVGDVGQNRLEELDVVPPSLQAGANYGWRAYEGTERFSDDRIDESRLVRPVLTYPLSGGACAVTGGAVYRGSAASLRGLYLYADFCIGRVEAIRVAEGRVAERHHPGLETSRLASFGEDASGEMYVASLAGPVYRIVL